MGRNSENQRRYLFGRTLEQKIPRKIPQIDDISQNTIDLVVQALTKDTFNYQGNLWVPTPGLTNPILIRVYTDYGEGVDPNMSINKIGIAPRPFQTPHPQLYGGFSASLRTAKFWAKYKGKPIVMSSDIDFL